MANTFVDIKSWPLLFSLITKRQLDNVNFNVVGRSYYAGDILLPYTQKKLSEVAQKSIDESRSMNDAEAQEFDDLESETELRLQFILPLECHGRWGGNDDKIDSPPQK